MDNTTRALQQAVSIDGWLGQFDENGVASVHADIVFRNGSFGEDPDSKIRFKIALKRAEIVLRIPDHEPIKVVRGSIMRTVASASGVKKTQKTQKMGLKAIAKAAASNLGLSGSAETEGHVETEKQQEITLSEDVTQFVEQHFPTPDGHYGWEIANHDASNAAYLKGSPWDAVEAPRMDVKHQTGQITNSVSMLVEIRCAREDIEILDLEEKDPEARQIFARKKNRDVNLAAAEQLIKEELFKAGFLDVPDLSEKHSRLLIADKVILVDD